MTKRRTTGATADKAKPGNSGAAQRRSGEPPGIEERLGPAGAVGEHAWVEVIRKMDEVYRELLNYEVALEQNNAALQESQLFISSVLSSMSDVLIVCDPDGIVEELNPSLLKLTGRPESEAARQLDSRAVRRRELAPRDRDIAGRTIRRACRWRHR